VDAADPIRLVTFDWGGVILKHHRSWADSCVSAGVEVRQGHDRTELVMQRRALNLQFQCGKLTPQEFYPKMAGATGGLYTAAEVRRIHDAWLTEEYPGIDAVIGRLTALTRVETALLSNTNECHWARMKDFPTAGLLKHRHASHLLGHAKPGPDIYRAFERATGFSGAEVLFFDDVVENVAAAVEVGWRAELIDYKEDTASQVAGHLARYGVF
jgi:HAD superfamily hydrolase (TIGR01509 family)